MLTRSHWLLELNTSLSAISVYVVTHLAKAARESASDGSNDDVEELYVVVSQGCGAAAFFLRLGLVAVGAASRKVGPTRWSGATMWNVQCLLEVVRFLSVVPFALAGLLVLVAHADGFLKAIAFASLAWELLLLAQLLTPLLAPRQADGSAEARVGEVSDLPPLLSEGRRVVPGEAKMQLQHAQTLAAARPLALPRQCSFCFNALPNTRCQPCGHAVACEPCLLQWARGAPTVPCRCPACDLVLEGYDVAADMGAYFLNSHLEGAGMDQGMS